MSFKKDIKTKMISIGLALALIGTSGAFAFAAAPSGQERIKKASIAETVENVTGIEKIKQSLSKTSREFVADGTYSKVVMPSSGRDYLKLNAKGIKQIKMGLPELLQNEKAKMSDNGTVSYGSNSDPISVGVQALSYHQGGELVEALQTAITINKPSAFKTYDFKYQLPKGYRLITATDYLDRFVTDREEKAYFKTFNLESMVYIVNEKNQIVNTLDKTWAEDANGNEIKVSYNVKNNLLKQTIDFNEATAFPVVVALASHPTKYRERSETVKNNDAGRKKMRAARHKLRDEANSSIAKIVETFSAIIGLFDGGTLSVAFSLVVGGRKSFLHGEQEVYMGAIEDCGITSNRIRSVVFTHHYRGNWQGKNKGYVYVAEHTTKRYKK